MKRILAIIAFATVTLTSHAQFGWGLKGGLNVTSMSLSSSVLEKSNHAGFYIGPTVKFSVPLVGIGFDAALLYDQREAEVDDKSVKQQQIAIPINLRYQLGLGDFAGLLIFAGPQFGINVGDGIGSEDWKWKSTNLSINVGLGVMLLNHLQVNANYNIACGKTGEATVGSIFKDNSDGKFNSWQIGLAYYF